MDQKLRKMVNLVFAMTVMKNAKLKKGSVKPITIKARSDWSGRHVSPNSNISSLSKGKTKS